METMKVSKAKAEEIQNLYQKKYAVGDLCVLLASKNELIDEGNLFYERLINDNSACIQALEAFWDDIKSKYDIVLKADEELVLNFDTGEIVLQKAISSEASPL